MENRTEKEWSMLDCLFGNSPAPRTFRRTMLVLALIAAALGWLALRQLPRSSQTDHSTAEFVVCVDPGHPSETNSGRLRQHGTCELDINWQVANRLVSLLNEDGRFLAFKTRDRKDDLMQNKPRALIANAAKADITVHLHCDSGANHGYTLYYPDREGYVEGKRGPVRSVRVASRKAAFAIHRAMSKELGAVLNDRGVKGEMFTKYGRINGGLTTSVYSEVPTVTIEMVFLNNKHDAEFIKSYSGQNRMAAALAEGIREFVLRRSSKSTRK